MAYISDNLQSPNAEYLYKIQMIVSNTEYKNMELAQKYETVETKLEGEKYVRAKTETDSFNMYEYNDKAVYQALLDSGYPVDKIYACIKDHMLIPINIQQKLLADARELFLAQYVEKNKYYCNLAGIPFEGTNDVPADRIFTIPEDFYNLYKDTGAMLRNQPIHTLPNKYKELFMNTPYYTQLLSKYRDAMYLRYIGSNSIPIEVSRKAKDGAIMRINTSKLSGYHRKFGNVSVSPDIVHLYTNTYNQVRDYVYNTLRGDFSSIYPNYNNFIRFLTIYMSIGQTLNELMKKSSSMSYMNNITANNYFMLYGLPSVIMEGQSMINFLKKFRLLLMDKGTNTVYRVKDYIGYKYTDIFSLIMVKQQVFENGKPKYTYDADGNPTPMYNLVFRRMGTTADKTSYFKFRDEEVEYDWKEIASGDPRWWWWNSPEVDAMLYEMNYTLSNSKYIQLSTHMSMSDIYWQCIILLRGLLDNKRETDYTPIAINYDIGIKEISVFEAVLCLIIIMNWNMTMINGKSFNGKIFNSQSECIDMLFNGLMDDSKTPNPLIPGKPFKVSSFNFEVIYSDWYKYELPTYDYLYDINDFLSSALDNKEKNVGELMMSNVRKVYDYLVETLLQSRTIHEFRQVTTAFNNLFLVDPIRKNWAYDLHTNTFELLSKKYGVQVDDLIAFQRFCETHPDTPPFVVNYNNNNYTIRFADILSTDIEYYEYDDEYPFTDDDFVVAYNKAIDSYTPDSNSYTFMKAMPLSITTNYKAILKDKVWFDKNTSGSNGPDTFEGLLMIENQQLYERLIQLKNEGTNVIYFMRAIIKGLETYTNSDLSALTFSAIGADEYIHILKEVISYFKSYMVEFTKEEFIYVMDGLFDNGGNSNMLRLYDEIHRIDLDMHIPESIALYDASYNKIEYGIKEKSTMYDEAIIRTESSYQHIKSLGYEILFDTGKKLTPTEPSTITNDSKVIGTLIKKGNDYAMIIPTNMISE